jgi:hypothetical protein
VPVRDLHNLYEQCNRKLRVQQCAISHTSRSQRIHDLWLCLPLWGCSQILPPSIYGRVTAIVGGNAGIKVENRTTGVLPQQLADRLGWDPMVATVARVYRSLPQDEQAEACIFTQNYGEAGAINFYGPQYHLPQAISGHNTYYLWGPGSCTGEVVISIGYPFDRLQTAFDSVTQAATSRCTFCMPEENNLPVYVCRHLKTSIQAIWPSVKHYD